MNVRADRDVRGSGATGVVSALAAAGKARQSRARACDGRRRRPLNGSGASGPPRSAPDMGDPVRTTTSQSRSRYRLAAVPQLGGGRRGRRSARYMETPKTAPRMTASATPTPDVDPRSAAGRSRTGSPRGCSPAPGSLGGHPSAVLQASSRSTATREAGSSRGAGTSLTFGTNDAASDVAAATSWSATDRIPSRPSWAISSRT